MEKIRKKIPEQWLILICCCLLTGATTGTNTVNGLFYNPVCSELGILKGTFNLQSLIGTAVTTVTMMVMPVILQRFSIKRLITLSVTATAFCYLADSFNSGVTGFFLVNMVKSFSSAFYSNLVTLMVINSWFRENNGTASSIMMCFSGAAGAVFSPIVSRVITDSGWRWGYSTLALFVLIFSLPVMMYPRNLIAAAEDRDERSGDGNETDRAAKRNRGTYAALVVFLVMCFSLAAFMSHVSGYCEAEGFSAEVGAFALSCNLLGNMIFKLADGFFADRYGVRKVSMIILSLPILSYILFLSAKSAVAVYAAAFLSGAANAGAGLAVNLVIRDVYGSARFGEVRSATSLFTQPAFAVFTAVAGYIYDFTGDYDLLLFIFIGFAVIQLLALDILYRRKERGLLYES